MSINIKPLGDRVVVKVSKPETKTASGLVLPDAATEKPQEGEIVAVGSGKTDDGKTVELEVKVGDKVLYSKYGGTEVKKDGEEYVILNSRDLLAIV